MKRYLLDTAPLSAYLLRRSAAVALVQPWISRHEATTSSLVQAEILEYFLGFSDFQRQRPGLIRVLRAIHAYGIPFPVLQRYATIRRQLRPPHGSGLIGDIDTFIAATAIEFNLTLVTSDSDFKRVRGLSVMLVASLT